ncbi:MULTISPECIES: hypothetical protein [Streptomyces]|uniref:DNA-binding protein n=1 Tax=Streptomyces fradiae ATCC 10745 = DSM 40063 TaxID=1319510 RepID=A0A1Y2NQI2_STRFR|nr:MULTISPECIES: hypothetical protein [Streptomyces]KAF0650250.1 hypothetical protein K701_08835 [Streptomyces fradiae ATCC 10745 = DSM 40063]OSY49359.1 hypothetical protein BG846_05048 [Streptomyces fradiae ATCC 10745 = DSM 40063]QEV12316.1 hypothetical protein CP974_10060 [Streptomyces fradiae ATCC 10745 = DSM 40063]
MPEWSFVLRLNQPLTSEQADAFDHCEAFADGSVAYVLGPEDPDRRGHHRADDPARRELMCDVEAPTLLEAVARVARDVRLIPGLRAVGVRHDDVVTLGEAAQRCSRSRQSLVQLSRGQRGSGGFPEPEVETGGTAFYSWAKIASYLRGIGDDIPPVSRDVVLADHILGVVDEVERADVPAPVLRSFGLAAA